MALGLSVVDRRIGVLGGTFDPIHIGHLILAEEVRVCLKLDQVLFVPALISPHKLTEEPCPAEDRLRMVELAVADNPAFVASRVDLDRPGPSYTADTLEILKRELGNDAELYFILGMDSLAGLPRWYQPQRVLALARLVAVSRPGHQVDLAEIERVLPGLRERLQVVTTLQIGISGTDLRRRVRLGLPIRYQVPSKVEEYIRERSLYIATVASEMDPMVHSA